MFSIRESNNRSRQRRGKTDMGWETSELFGMQRLMPSIRLSDTILKVCDDEKHVFRHQLDA